MTANPVIEKLGRRLRLGVLGGGPGSVIGEVHRTAARLDDRYEVVGGVLSSNPERSCAAGRALGWAPERAYGDVDEMLGAETARPDGVDVVAIMTPNDSHYPLACRWLDAGRDVICDKPLTTNLDEARDLVRRVRASGLVFCTTYNYSAYPMVRQARAMVADGEIGDLRLAQVEYIQPQLADASRPRRPRLLALTIAEALGAVGDPRRHRHPCLAPACIRSPANGATVGLARTSVAVIPGRRFDDTAGGAASATRTARSGMLWVTQAAAGAEHGLRFRIHGADGGLEWHQEDPTWLTHMRLEQAAPQSLSRRRAGAQAGRCDAGEPHRHRPSGRLPPGSVREPLLRRRRGGRGAPHGHDRRTLSPSTSRPSRTGRGALPSPPPPRRRRRRAAPGPTARL